MYVFSIHITVYRKEFKGLLTFFQSHKKEINGVIICRVRVEVIVVIQDLCSLNNSEF